MSAEYRSHKKNNNYSSELGAYNALLPLKIINHAKLIYIRLHDLWCDLPFPKLYLPRVDAFVQ